MQSRLLVITGILSSLLLVSCGPKAPRLTFCVVDAPGDLEPVCICRSPDKVTTTISIEDCHKYIAQPAEDAELLQDYVLALERRVANCR
jgi:hypothetical protein